VKRTLPAILWTAVVLAASTDLFSGAHTGAVIARITTAVFPTLSAGTVDTLNFLIRKSAHLAEYGILAWLWFRALRGESTAGWMLRWALLAVIIAAGVATLDEWHQSFVPSRTSSPWDVVLDTVGATLAQVIIRLRRPVIISK
jgi:VanZ family protein